MTKPHYEAVVPQPEGENVVASYAQVWVCGACGKTARSRYGFDDDGTPRGGPSNADSGWDASCMMNSALCWKPEDFLRADGDVVCKLCGKEYRHHPYYERELGPEDHNGKRQPFLRKLCNGRRVKL